MRPPRIDFYDATDGRRLAVRVWDANQPPRAHVVFLHGISSHGGWYNRSGEYLANAGFTVHFVDRRGSGLNAAEPGDVDRWQTWVNDVSAYLEQIRDGNRVVLGGISWGGKLAATVARIHPARVDALALICPGLYSPYEPRLLKRLVLSLPLPIGLQNRRVQIPLRRPALFTDSPTWREFIASDPFALRQVTWRFARESQRLTRCARQAAPFIHMPLLLMLAGRDRIVNNRRTVDFFRRTTAVKRTLIEYPVAAHTLEFEPDPQEYFSDLAGWIGKIASRCPCD